MNAYQLLTPDQKPSGVWVCAECKLTSNSEGCAQRCCCCGHCGKQVNFNNTMGRLFSHSECDRAARSEYELKLFVKAEKLKPEQYKGPVYSESGGGNEGYFNDFDAYLEHIYDESEDVKNWPEYVWACTIEHHAIDPDDIIQNLVENGYEDMQDQLSGEKELIAAVKAFNEANKDVVSWMQDTKRAVLVPSRDEVFKRFEPSESIC